MSKKSEDSKVRTNPTDSSSKTARGRRALLKRLGRFAAVTGPTVTLLLAAQTKPGRAAPSGCATCQPTSSRAFKTTEGSVQATAVLCGLAGVSKTIDPIDGVGICFAAIKALSKRVDALAAALATSA
jgi:hypothetical protein